MRAPIWKYALLVRAQDVLLAIPIEHVVETMRPLDLKTINRPPQFVLGVSIIRGVPVPVVSAARLMGQEASQCAARFVTLRIRDRVVALAVTEVKGLVRLDDFKFQELPPLLQGANQEAVAGLCALDSSLLLVLQASRILSETVLQELSRLEIST